MWLNLNLKLKLLTGKTAIFWEIFTYVLIDFIFDWVHCVKEKRHYGSIWFIELNILRNVDILKNVILKKKYPKMSYYHTRFLPVCLHRLILIDIVANII